MVFDPLNFLIGSMTVVLPAALGLWRALVRVSASQLTVSLLEQQLASQQVQLAQCQEQAHTLEQALDQAQGQLARSQAQLAAFNKEAELLRHAQGEQQQQLREQQQLHANQEAELRRVAAERAALEAELREQQSHHQLRLNDLNSARDELRAQFAELAGRIFDEREQRFAQTSEQRLGQLLDPLKEHLKAFEKKVEDSYQNEARERFSLGKELERLQLLNQRLGDEATNLTRALKGQKTQGNWGELVLERVLEQAGLEKDREYFTQVSLKSAEGERFQPDVLIQLPGEKQIIVDAKVSLTAWQQWIAAEDEASRQQALKQHLISLRAHLKGLSGKDYQRLEGLTSLDFVLLFMPIEAAFAAAVQAEPELFQEAFAQRVVIVSPTTLLATLRVIDSLWRQERQSQNAREIAERAGQLYDKFVAFVGDLDEVGTRLGQLDKAYAAARNKLVDGRGNLVGRVENLKLLGARASKALPAELLDKAAALALPESSEVD